jgi:hypothetical protein
LTGSSCSAAYAARYQRSYCQRSTASSCSSIAGVGMFLGASAFSYGGWR